MSNYILLPAPYFPDPDTNQPVANGSVYIGEPDTDPTVEGNRITVTIIEQDGNEVTIAPAAQPLETGDGGVVMYNGSPVAALSVATNFSMTVLRSDDTQAYYFPNAGIPDLVANLQASAYTYLDNVAGTDIVTADASPAITAYVPGALYQFIPANSNTGAVTLNINSLGAGNLLYGGVALLADMLTAGAPALVMVLDATPTFGLVSVANVQDPSAVTITGGTIDGTPIGGTTRAAGEFTTLEAEAGGSGTPYSVGVTGSVNVTPVGNVGTGTDDLMTYSLPADTLSTDGDTIEVIASGKTANNANAKTLGFAFGSSVLTKSMTVSIDGRWWVHAFITRSANNAQRISAFFTESTITLSTTDKSAINSGIIGSETDSNAITIKFTGDATSNDDIVQDLMIVRVLNAP